MEVKEAAWAVDAACSGNPGDGGWCAILIYNNNEKVISGYVSDTTNNRMEMLSVIEALSALKEPCSVEIFSDSEYVVDSINLNRVDDWMKNGWKTSGSEQDRSYRH